VGAPSVYTSGEGQFDLEVVSKYTNGAVALLLTKYQVRPKNGVQYFGVQVRNLPELKKRLQDGGVAVSENAKDQFQLNVPEGNRVVLTESGWLR
jgi:hypothetical protein